MLADLSALTSAELISRVRSTRESIAEFTSTNFVMLEELRNRVGGEGGVIIADDLVAVIDPQKQIQSLNSSAIRNEFTHEEMVEKKFIQLVNRRQAVRIYPNPTKLQVEVE
jgi:hypothetical protein